jgi:hypothetical protein
MRPLLLPLELRLQDNDAVNCVINSLRLLKDPVCLNSAKSFCYCSDYTSFTNGTGSADYTTTSQTAVPAATGTVGITTADTIAESMRPLLLSLERLRLLEQSMIMMRSTVATITPASATEGSPAVFEFSLSLLLLRRPLHSPMELLEVLITLPHETGGCYYGNITL